MSFNVDNQPGGTTNPLQEARKPDLRVKLLRLYLLFAVLILAGALVFAFLLNNQLQRDVRLANLSQTQSLAGQMNPQSDPALVAVELASWLDVIGGEGPIAAFIVGQSQEVIAEYRRDAAVGTSREWGIWQSLILRTALFNRSGSFTTTAPDGQEWLHTYATLPESRQRLIIQRPERIAFATSQLFTFGLIGAMVIYLTGGIFSWFILSYRVIQPLEDLESYSERIRWRGHLPAAEQERIDRLAQREDQLGNLTRSLRALQADTETRLVQLATLLETSRIVAASLESTEVIDNIFNQVQTHFGVMRSAVVVMDQRAGVFRIRASRGLSEGYAEQLRIAPSEPNSPSMRALRNQTPIQVADTETDLAFVNLRERSRLEGFRSVLAIPLRTQHSPPAVLLLYRSHPYRYSYSELELASSFGHHASIALENAALYAKSDERLQEQSRQLEAIVESLNDGLILESLTGEVLYCNQRALSWLRISPGQAKSKSSVELTEILLAEVDDAAEIRQEMNALPDQLRGRTFDLTLGADNGHTRDLRIHHFDVTDVQGQLLGCGQLWQDISHDKELDRMKSALLSTASHELRTPLATIKGFASTLLAKDVKWDETAQREFLEAISNEADRLTRLVQNLLDMSRLEAGILTIQCELFSLNEVLSQVLQRFGATLDERFRADMARDLPPVWMDISRIGTVIRNLIENALKYAAPDSAVEISTRSQNGQVIFTVRDYGPGIPLEFQQKVFDRFFRLDNGLSRRVGGSGLGLAISQGFVQAHGGKIWVSEADPGAIFAFSLPLERKCDEG